MAVYLFKAKSKAFDKSQFGRGAVRPQNAKHRTKPPRMQRSRTEKTHIWADGNAAKHG